MLNNTHNHFFFAAFLSCLALRSLESFLLKVKALNLSKSVRDYLLAWLAYDFPKGLESKFFCTFSFAIVFLNFPEVTPLPTLRTCFVS